MKFICDQCQSKYSIDDSRVRGKVLKIRCKQCNFVITVREEVVAQPVRSGAGVALAADFGGEQTQVSDPSALQALLAGANAARGRSAAPAPAALDDWFVSFDGEQEGPYSIESVVSRTRIEMATGRECFAWRDGFPAWLPVLEVPELARALRPAAPAPPPVRVATPIVKPPLAKPAIDGAALRKPSGDARPAPEGGALRRAQLEAKPSAEGSGLRRAPVEAKPSAEGSGLRRAPVEAKPSAEGSGLRRAPVEARLAPVARSASPGTAQARPAVPTRPAVPADARTVDKAEPPSRPAAPPVPRDLKPATPLVGGPPRIPAATKPAPPISPSARAEAKSEAPTAGSKGPERGAPEATRAPAAPAAALETPPSGDAKRAAAAPPAAKPEATGDRSGPLPATREAVVHELKPAVAHEAKPAVAHEATTTAAHEATATAAHEAATAAHKATTTAKSDEPRPSEVKPEPSRPKMPTPALVTAAKPGSPPASAASEVSAGKAAASVAAAAAATPEGSAPGAKSHPPTAAVDLARDAPPSPTVAAGASPAPSRNGAAATAPVRGATDAKPAAVAAADARPAPTSPPGEAARKTPDFVISEPSVMMKLPLPPRGAGAAAVSTAAAPVVIISGPAPGHATWMKSAIAGGGVLIVLLIGTVIYLMSTRGAAPPTTVAAAVPSTGRPAEDHPATVIDPGVPGVHPDPAAPVGPGEAASAGQRHPTKRPSAPGGATPGTGATKGVGAAPGKGLSSEQSNLAKLYNDVDKANTPGLPQAQVRDKPQAQASDTEIRDVVMRNKPMLQACYNSALKRDPTMRKVRVDIGLKIGVSGSVTKVSLPDEYATSDFGGCLQQSIRRWHFPSLDSEYDAQFPLLLQAN